MMPTHRSLTGRLASAAVCVLLLGCGSQDGGSTAPIAASPSAASSPAAPSDVPAASAEPAPSAEPAAELREYPVPAGSHPHDVAPTANNGIWYTGQRNGTLGHLDPATVISARSISVRAPRRTA
jgi:streptogramin lyase